jgi:tetratricopeptide (TPR) repeat protein
MQSLEKTTMQIEDVEALFVKSIEVSRERLQNGDLDTALAVLKQLIRCDEDHGEALQLIGLIHHKKGEHSQAIPYFLQATFAEPNNPDNYNNLALSLSCTGKVETAIGHLEHAIDLCRGREGMMDQEARFRSNLAVQLRQTGRYEEAIMQLKIALDYNDKDATFWQNLGGVYGEMHLTNEAVECYRKSIVLEPENAVAHTDLAYGLHLLGQYEEAWEEYEWRYKAFSSFPQMTLYNFRFEADKRLKKGDDTSGKRVIVFCEQGLGDTLQFIRYVAQLPVRTHIILHCSSELAPLLENSKSILNIAEFCTTPLYQFDVPVPDHDYHVSLLSLPYLTDKAVLPMPVPYIRTKETANLGTEYFKIGIAWAGSPTHPNDVIRSCPLKFFKPLADLPGVKLYSFQKDTRPRQYRNRVEVLDLMEGVDFKITDLGEHMADFNKTAALLDDMDMVVTVDTSILHLAGALQLPTIGLIAYNPCWRWGVEGNTSPWYRTMSLVRQENPGDWQGVMARVVELVKEKTKCVPSIA